jgi:nucleoside-diphosphate-sugar epimerase
VAGPRVLVTGAAGFFGSAIVRALALDGAAVTATDRVDEAAYSPRADVPRDAVTYVRRDVAGEPLDDLVAAAGIVVHAAALTPADEHGDTSDELLRVNLAPLPGLLRAARESDSCGRIVFVSSAGVFDQRAERELAEEDADGGTSLYGAAKLAAEQVVRRYGLLNGLETASIRPTSLFGAGELPRPSRPRTTSLSQLVEHARRGEPVAVERTWPRADWLCVDDAAEAVRTLCRAESLDGRSYNLSSGRTRPFSDVVAAVVSAAGLAVDPTGHVVDPGPDRGATIANGRIVETFGWRPARSLEDGVRDLLAYLETADAAAGAR